MGPCTCNEGKYEEWKLGSIHSQTEH